MKSELKTRGLEIRANGTKVIFKDLKFFPGLVNTTKNKVWFCVALMHFWKAESVLLEHKNLGIFFKETQHQGS